MKLKSLKRMLWQRGRVKEEEFVKKVQEMMHVEEKQQIPIAQGLPWTTDELDVRCLVILVKATLAFRKNNELMPWI
ncbi:hypothetical protein LWI29_005673 [Acer saccharum]|uniref:Uncharacterized protein n=1 Tax=Acer saccharum TaxID=4024 RepID=A0AA39VMK9_ACESA|nr:hypothetical protein LWI29_005673 [Acer saccharum]